MAQSNVFQIQLSITVWVSNQGFVLDIFPMAMGTHQWKLFNGRQLTIWCKKDYEYSWGFCYCWLVLLWVVIGAWVVCSLLVLLVCLFFGGGGSVLIFLTCGAWFFLIRSESICCNEPCRWDRWTNILWIPKYFFLGERVEEACVLWFYQAGYVRNLL